MRHRPICIAPLRAHWQPLPEAPRGSAAEAAGAAAALDLAALVHFHAARTARASGDARGAARRARCGLILTERAQCARGRAAS